MRTVGRLWESTSEIVAAVAHSDSGSPYPPFIAACAVCYTDFWEAYEQVLPRKRHQAVGKETGKTSYIERFNNTLRQRVRRLVRKTLSFSKKLSNHLGAVWCFVHHYNALLRS